METKRRGIRRWFGITNTFPLAALAAFVTLAVVAVALGMPSEAHADHGGVYAVCPDPIEEGNTGSIGVRRSGHKIKSAFFFTDNRYHTADGDDYVEYHGFKVQSSGGESTLRAPIVTKEDTLPEHDETFAIGFWDDDVWHHCVVTIEDDDAPEIVHVSIASSPVDQYAYHNGDAIDIAVDFDQKVDAGADANLALYLGDEDDSVWRGASYEAGSGTRSLIFRYRVQPEDFDGDGLRVAAAATGDDRSPAYGFGGDIFAEGTDVPVEYGHEGVTGGWKQKVDGRPYVQETQIISSPSDGWTAYRANEVIEVLMRFDTDVVVDGDVSVELHLGVVDYNWDGVIREAGYLRGSGTDTLIFGYTVRPGDMDAEGVGIVLGTEESGFAGGGTIKAKGTDVERNPYYLGTGHQAEHKVDSSSPSVSSIRFTSRPANGDAYADGESIAVEVTFDERVAHKGALHLNLDIGGVARQATAEASPSLTYGYSSVFHYVVQDGDTDIDGVGISANSLRAEGAGVYDSAGNTADLGHPVVPADPGQKVATH